MTSKQCGVLFSDIDLQSFVYHYVHGHPEKAIKSPFKHFDLLINAIFLVFEIFGGLCNLILLFFIFRIGWTVCVTLTLPTDF